MVETYNQTPQSQYAPASSQGQSVNFMRQRLQPGVAGGFKGWRSFARAENVRDSP